MKRSGKESRTEINRDSSCLVDDGGVPLAARMRPRTLEEFIGQPHILGEGKLLRRAIEADRVTSVIFWGPPGVGKTTIARLLASETDLHFVQISAIFTGVADLKKVFEAAKIRHRNGRGTLLFVDEIHRFNKAQQDALLPHVEDGTVTLVGATTENPSFAVNGALLSRGRVFRLESLSDEALTRVIQRAVAEPGRGLGGKVEITDEGLEALVAGASGDARRALTTLETLAADRATIDAEAVSQAYGTRTLLHDKSGDGHYDVVSAFIKSMRGTDPDASLYWMFRLLDAGEDPRFVLRRMIIFASEDIGNADPRALQLAVAADQAFHRLGMPEALHSLSQCCTYLAAAPKSNATYDAFKAARADVEAHGALPVPKKLRNAPTKLMKAEGHGDGYRYPHDEGGYAAGETYFPEKLVGRRYYFPRDSGLEARIAERLASLRGDRDPTD